MHKCSFEHKVSIIFLQHSQKLECAKASVHLANIKPPDGISALLWCWGLHDLIISHGMMKAV